MTSIRNVFLSLALLAIGLPIDSVNASENSSTDANTKNQIELEKFERLLAQIKLLTKDFQEQSLDTKGALGAGHTIAHQKINALIEEARSSLQKLTSRESKLDNFTSSRLKQDRKETKAFDKWFYAKIWGDDLRANFPPGSSPISKRVEIDSFLQDDDALLKGVDGPEADSTHRRGSRE